MLQKLRSFIEKNKLIQANERVLVALSGGRDSVVLLDLLVKVGFDVAVAHCNFQLRGEASDQDETFCADLAKAYGIPFFHFRFDTKTKAKEFGISTQMVARNLRYDWFKAISEEHNFNKIATAHHLNDSIETVLLNLTKGTGLSGLLGIPVQNELIIRPLLFATREEIDAYVAENNLQFREDESNQSTDYQRNKLRHLVVPILKEINPNFEQTFETTLERLNATAKNLPEKPTPISTEPLTFQKKDFLVFDDPLSVLIETFKDFGFNFKQIKNLSKALLQTEAKTFETTDYRLTLSQDLLIVNFKNENFDLGLNLKFRLIDFDLNNPDNQALIKQKPIDKAHFDFEKLLLLGIIKPEEIEARLWQQGDAMRPLGMKGQKKISDILIDAKVTMQEKEKTQVLLANNEIIWLVGHRVSDKTKVDANTKRVLEVRLK